MRIVPLDQWAAPGDVVATYRTTLPTSPESSGSTPAAIVTVGPGCVAITSSAPPSGSTSKAVVLNAALNVRYRFLLAKGDPAAAGSLGEENVVLVVATRRGIVHWEGDEVSVLTPTLAAPVSASPRGGDGSSPLLGMKRERHTAPSPLETTVEETPGVRPPVVGSIVHAFVRRVNRQAAYADILAVDGVPLNQRTTLYKATIRIDDAKTLTADEQTALRGGHHSGSSDSSGGGASSRTVTCTNFFRPGDIILADVIAVGDGQTLQLSTKDPAFGVVDAAPSAAACAPLRFVSGNRYQMVCSATGHPEARLTPLVRPSTDVRAV